MPANNNHPSQQNVSNVIFEQIPTVTAGNNLNYNFSYHGRNKLFLLSFRFTTSATAANRLVHIVCGKASLEYRISSSSSKQAASYSKMYYFGIGYPNNSQTTPYAYHGPLPDGYLFFFSNSLKTSIDGLQDDDQLSNISIITEFQPTRRVF